MQRLYDGFYAALGVVAAALIAAMALLISADVVMRNVGLGSIPWVLEVTEYLQYAAAFLGAPWVLWRGAHIRVDLLLHAVPARVGRYLEMLANLFGVGISATLLWFSAAVTHTDIVDGSLIIKSLIIPEWWIFALLAVASLLLFVEFCRRLWLARLTPLPADVSSL